MSHAGITFTRSFGRIADGGIVSTTWGALRIPRRGRWVAIGATASGGGAVSLRINRTDNGDTPPDALYGEDCAVGYDRWQVVPPAQLGLRADQIPLAVEDPSSGLPVQVYLVAGQSGGEELVTITFQLASAS